VDYIAIFLALISGVILWNFKKIQEPHIILMSAVIGFVLKTYIV
jgi:hypothetical protein